MTRVQPQAGSYAVRIVLPWFRRALEVTTTRFFAWWKRAGRPRSSVLDVTGRSWPPETILDRL